MVKANILNGMKEITAFVGFSEVTVIKHKREYPGMPISKKGGLWIGDPQRLEQFYKDMAAGETEKWLGLPAEVGMGKAEDKAGEVG
ncbi:MAG: hypothetical protein V1806_07620 [Pseudomonadota bacterium]